MHGVHSIPRQYKYIHSKSLWHYLPCFETRKVVVLLHLIYKVLQHCFLTVILWALLITDVLWQKDMVNAFTELSLDDHVFIVNIDAVQGYNIRIASLWFPLDIEAVEAGSENNQDQELESDDLGIQQYRSSIQSSLPSQIDLLIMTKK